MHTYRYTALFACCCHGDCCINHVCVSLKGCGRTFRTLNGVRYHVNNFHARKDQDEQSWEESESGSEADVGVVTVAKGERTKGDRVEEKEEEKEDEKEEEEIKDGKDKNEEDESMVNFKPLRAQVRKDGHAVCPREVGCQQCYYYIQHHCSSAIHYWGIGVGTS